MGITKIGVIGVGSRGGSLLNTLLATGDCEITAIADLYPDRVEKAQEKVEQKTGKRPAGYPNGKALIDGADVEAVLLSCDWEEHIPLAIYAMKKKKIVASEVAGAYSIKDCWDLVDAYEETKTPIMLMENCCFDEFELLATNCYRHGLLGEIVYAHGCYGHDLREEIEGGNVNRHYRLRNYLNRNVENYPTHELGPIAKALDINRGNRILYVQSSSSRPGWNLDRYESDPRCPDPTLKGKHFAQADVVSSFLGTEKGQLISIRLDTSLPRYYSREFTLRGTEGLAFADGKIILSEKDGPLPEIYDTYSFYEKYHGCSDKYNDYLPAIWRQSAEEIADLGHGGMDYIEFKEFFRCLQNGLEMPIDVYDMATWMAVTPLSEESLKQNGARQEMPDFTRGKYKTRPSKDVIALP